VGTYTGGTAVCDPGYKIKIREQGGEDFTTEDDSDASFSISEIDVTDPDGGESWQKGDSKNITWDACGLVNDVKITLWKSGTLIGLIAKDLSPSPGSYPWTVGNYDGGTAASGSGYKIKIREQGGALFTTEDSSYSSFSISSSSSSSTPSCPPFVVYEPPLNKEYSIAYDKVNIKWKNKLVAMKKITQAEWKPDGKHLAINNLHLKKRKRVRIDIKSVKCTLVVNFNKKLKELYIKKGFQQKKIEKLMKIPWSSVIPTWKKIDTVYDTGSYSWKIPEEYKKGCYIIRVIRLWCESGDTNRIAFSKRFQLIPLDMGIGIPGIVL
ncbi:MAG: hypothetical protein ABFR75_14555, partial [Acidobacteriota bacterium]